LEDLEGFRGCGWNVASALPAELATIGAAAAAHGAGSAIISSCQRIEVYHTSPCNCGAPQRWAGVDALQRLAEVAAGLHSLVLGEEQILGQVRTALSAASEDVQALGGLAVAAARQLRGETQFRAHTGHLLDRALHLAEVPAGGTIAIAGAGPVGRLVAARALEIGFLRVTILGRREPDGSWFDPARMDFHALDGLADLAPVDVLVTCIGSSAAALGANELPQANRLIVDLGTPRNVCEPVNAPLVTIAMMWSDHSSQPHSEARRSRLRARLSEILERRRAQAEGTSASPVGRLRYEVERVRVAEVDRIRRLHPDLAEGTVEAITRSLVKQIFHRPTERLRALDDPELGARFAALFAADSPIELEAQP
jgi:glutamyl-tRNA reductase